MLIHRNYQQQAQERSKQEEPRRMGEWIIEMAPALTASFKCFVKPQFKMRFGTESYSASLGQK